MCLSKLFFKTEVHNALNDRIHFDKSSLISRILKRKQNLFKKMEYFQALQIPKSKEFKECLCINNEKIIYLNFIKSNYIDFYHDVLFYFNYKISSICTDQSCRAMSVGPCRIYFWPLNKDQEENEENGASVISAEFYIKNSLKWIYSVLNDMNFLSSSSDKVLKNDFSVLKLITKRLYRFYGHCYYNHSNEIKKDENDYTFFYLSMRFFISFSLKYDLLDSFEFDPLRMIVYPFTEYNQQNFEENSDSDATPQNNVLLTSDSE